MVIMHLHYNNIGDYQIFDRFYHCVVFNYKCPVRKPGLLFPYVSLDIFPSVQVIGVSRLWEQILFLRSLFSLGVGIFILKTQIVFFKAGILLI